MMLTLGYQDYQQSWTIQEHMTAFSLEILPKSVPENKRNTTSFQMNAYTLKIRKHWLKIKQNARHLGQKTNKGMNNRKALPVHTLATSREDSVTKQKS